MNRMQQHRPTTWVGYAFALGATIIWSGNFIVARGLYESVSPATLAFLRWLTATLALLPLAAPAVWRERHAIRQNFSYLLATAFLGVTVFNTLIYFAARFTSALNLSLIATASPIFTLIFARIFLGEALTAGRVTGLLIAISGVFILVTRGDISMLRELHFSVGDIGMVLAAMIFGAYTVLVRCKPDQVGQSAFLLSIFALGLGLLAPVAAWEVLSHGLPNLRFPLLASVLYLGMGASLASYSLWNKAIVTIGPARCGFVYYSLPVFSGIEALLFLGEPASWVHAGSGLLILSGIVLANHS